MNPKQPTPDLPAILDFHVSPDDCARIAAVCGVVYHDEKHLRPEIMLLRIEPSTTTVRFIACDGPRLVALAVNVSDPDMDTAAKIDGRPVHVDAMYMPHLRGFMAAAAAGSGARFTVRGVPGAEVVILSAAAAPEDAAAMTLPLSTPMSAFPAWRDIIPRDCAAELTVESKVLRLSAVFADSGVRVMLSPASGFMVAADRMTHVVIAGVDTKDIVNPQLSLDLRSAGTVRTAIDALQYIANCRAFGVDKADERRVDRIAAAVVEEAKATGMRISSDTARLLVDTVVERKTDGAVPVGAAHRETPAQADPVVAEVKSGRKAKGRRPTRVHADKVTP